MHILPPVHEFGTVGIFDSGVPNRERIVMRPTQILNLAEFALTVSSVDDNGSVTPIPDLFLWLGELWVTPPSWIVVFTGPGSFNQGAHSQTGETVFELHWGRANTIFGSPNLAVSLLRIGGISSQTAPRFASTAIPRVRNPAG